MVTKVSSLLVVSVAVSLFLPAGALAADTKSDGSGAYLGLFGGVHGFARNGALEVDNQEPGTPFLGGVRVGYDFASQFALEAEVGVLPGWYPNEDFFLVIPARLNGLFFFRGLGPVRPFLLFGGGVLFPMDIDTTVGEIHAGLGLDLRVMDGFSLRLEGRGVSVFNNANAEWLDWEALAGISFTFGGAPPAAAEPAPKPAPPPEPAKPVDSDGDGIEDSADRCPNQAGITENDGCPDTDGDGDGVVDRLDQCRDVQGAAEDQGCPPKDSDNDGIFDRQDKCPNEAENKNSYQDTDGCPDEVPKQLQQFTGSIQGIQFRTGSAQLLRSSMGLLDKAAATLKQFPELKVAVSGHTDNVGDPEKNKTLSQARADTVKDYLINKGVDAARLNAVGYGDTRPVADNGTAEGRQQNRRVEFELNQ